ncbi:MAG: LysE family transporter [Calditrichota bacterium]|jgi:threonine/homoserine/homoserine lactone efflux protein
MTVFLLLFTAYVMGFFTAIPVGATQIEIAKRALNHKLWAAWMVVLGSVSSDVMYGAVALFGLAPFLKNKLVVAWFELIGTLILWILVYFTFKEARKPHVLKVNHEFLGKKHLSFFTGFGLAVSNPMMIFWWLLEVQFVIHLGLVDSFSPTLSALFLLFGGLGLGSYLSLLASVLYWVKKFVSTTVMTKIYYSMGFVLLFLSFYFLYNSVKNFAG